MAVLFLALGCQGTSGGILPDAREYDAAIDPCSDPTEWSMKEARPIAPYERALGALAVDESYAYWTEFLICGVDGGCLAGPIVRRAPLEGGEAEILFESEADQADALAVTRDYLFVVIGDQLWRSQKDGTAPEIVGAAAELAADADAVYFWQDGQLMRLAADTLEQVPIGMAQQQIVTEFQLAGGAAWWLEPDPVAIWRMPLATGVAEIAGQIEETVGQSLAVDGLGRAFLATWPRQDPASSGTLVRLVADGTGAEPLAELSEGTEVAVDDAHVYWMEPNAGRLSRMPLDGGCVESRDLDAAAALLVPVADGVVVVLAGTIALVER